MSSPASKRVTRSQTRSDANTHTPATLAANASNPPTTATAPTPTHPASPIDLTSDTTQSAYPPHPPTAHSPHPTTSTTPTTPTKRKHPSYFDQTPRRIIHARLQSRPRDPASRRFDYDLDYAALDLRAQPQLYRVGVGEQGVLLCQPYKAEILPHWRFRTPQQATESSEAIERLWAAYQRNGDFVGQDMARKFLQMGYTRSRRYANHKDGRKYDSSGRVRALDVDAEKAQSAEVFRVVWKRVEADEEYQRQKIEWKKKYG